MYEVRNVKKCTTKLEIFECILLCTPLFCDTYKCILYDDAALIGAVLTFLCEFFTRKCLQNLTELATAFDLIRPSNYIEHSTECQIAECLNEHLGVVLSR